MTALPDVPACWSWPLPPLPLPCWHRVVIDWQAGRCAICGRDDVTLQEDHAHASGGTRGWLCPGCNVREHGSTHPAFVGYRARPPSAILGVLLRYNKGVHPEIRDARIAWQHALGTVAELIRAEDEHQTRLRVAAGMCAAGYTREQMPWARLDQFAPIRIRRAVDPLVLDALRTRHRPDERRWMRGGWEVDTDWDALSRHIVGMAGVM